MVELARVPSKGQIDTFQNLYHSIGPCANKKKLLRNNYKKLKVGWFGLVFGLVGFFV